MIQLADGRTELWQWDTGRTVSVDEPCTQVHFSNKIYGHSFNVDVTDGTAKIPDELLQSCADLKCWSFVGSAEDGYTRLEKIFKINRRNKPADYVFTPTEQKTLKSIQDQIGDLADLDTKAKNNLVAAINEARKSGGGAVDVTAEDVSYTQADEGWNNVKQALDGLTDYLVDYGGAIDDLGKNTHTHANKPVLDKLSVADGKLQYNGSDIGLKGDTGATGPQGEPGADGYTPVKGIDYWTEEDKAEIVEELKPSQVTSGTSITIADNTEYRLTDVTELTLTYPDGNFECWMRLAFAGEGTITVTLPAATQYIGSTPTFANGETWELSIKDGIVIAGKVA